MGKLRKRLIPTAKEIRSQSAMGFARRPNEQEKGTMTPVELALPVSDPMLSKEQIVWLVDILTDIELMREPGVKDIIISVINNDISEDVKNEVLKKSENILIDKWSHYYRENKLQEALNVINLTASLVPDSYDARYKMALTYLVMGMSKSAIDLFAKLTVIRPHDHQPLFYLAAAYEANHQYEEALGIYDSIEHTNPNLAQVNNNRGLAYMKLGQYKKAASEFDKARTLRPDNLHVWFNHGLACIQLANYAEAVNSLKQALQLDFESIYGISIVFNIGLAQIKLNRFNEAINEMNQVARKYSGLSVDKLPSHLALIYSLRGMAYGRDGRYGNAIEDYDRALTMNDKDFAALNNKGIAFRKQGKSREAIECFRQVYKIRGKLLAESINNEGNVYADMKYYDEAAKHYQQSIALNPKLKEPHYNLNLLRERRLSRQDSIDTYSLIAHHD